MDSILCVPEDAVVPLRGGAGAGAGAYAIAPSPSSSRFGTGLFHLNQLNAAAQTVDIFREGTIRHVILRADVQSGKTGTYNAVIRHMRLEGLVDHAYVLCGSSETSLRNQARSDAKHYNPEFVAEPTLSVYFRQEFKRARLQTEAGRILVVVDESHMDEGNGMQLDRFLRKHGLHMTGTTPFMQENEIFILSVSATPYAECAAKAHEMSYPKALVKLEPGPGYFGPRDYLKAGLVRRTFDIAAKPHDFLALVRAPENRKKYAILRLNNSRTYNAVLTLARRHKIPVRVYNGRHQTIAITAEEARAMNEKRGPSRQVTSLEDEPETTTLVLLKQRLRAGKVVPKAHIGFVWEDAADANTDTLIQGLFGRMCGYDVPADPPHIYLPAAALLRDEGALVAFSEVERHCFGFSAGGDDALLLPTKAAYLSKKGTHAAKAAGGRTQCAPLHLPGFLPEALRNFDTAAPSAVQRALLEKLRDEIGRVEAHRVLTREQRTEVTEALLATLPSRVHLRHGHVLESGEPSHKRYIGRLIAAAGNGKPPHEHIEGCHPINFFVVYNGYTHMGAVPGDVYAIFYTNAATPVSKQPLLPRIPAPCPCAFTFHDSGIESLAVATGKVTLTAAIDENRYEFLRQMRRILDLWSVGQMDPVLSAYKSRFLFSRSAYGDLEQFNRLLKSLGLEYSCRFRVEGVEEWPAKFAIATLAWARE